MSDFKLDLATDGGVLAEWLQPVLSLRYDNDNDNDRMSSSLSTYMKYLDKDKTSQHVSDGKPSTGGKQSRNKPDVTEHSQKEGIAWFFVLMMTFFLFTYTFHCTWVTSEAYSSPSIVLSARSHDGSRIIFETND